MHLSIDSMLRNLFRNRSSNSDSDNGYAVIVVLSNLRNVLLII